MKNNKEIYIKSLNQEPHFNNKKSFEFELKYYLDTLKRSEKVFSMINYLTSLNLKNKEILDAGCGSGGIAISLAKKGAKCTGIDILKSRINLAEKIAKQEKVHVNFVQKDLTKNIFNKNYFDIIIATDFIEHTNSRKMVLILMNYLKKDGMFIFKINNFMFPYEPHIKSFFIHFLPNKIIDKYLMKFYPDFFRHYSTYNEIFVPTYFKLKKFLRGFDFKIFPIFYPFLPNKKYKILSKIFSSSIMNLICQSWIVVCKYKK